MKKVLIIDENLMLNSKIKELAVSSGYEAKIIAFFKEKDIPKLDEFNPDFVVINLESKRNDVFNLIPKIKEKNIKVIGYCGHTRTDLAKKAKESRVDFVATNGMITSQLPQILEGLK
jgi:chemotaxis response regulator CheB